jgi:hypothetical protein
MDVLLKDELVNKKYTVKYIKVNDLPLLVNSCLGRKKIKITEIFWRFKDNILPNQVKINMENVYYTNVTHYKYLTKIYHNIFYKNFSNYKNMDNIMINFGCENMVELLVVYENYNNNIHNYLDDDIFYL